jgi:hypothetical protein
MKAKRSRRELAAQKGGNNEMEREDGREDDVNAKRNGTARTEAR